MTDDPLPPVPRGSQDVGDLRPGAGAGDVPEMKVYAVQVRNPIAVWAMAIAALAVGGVLFVLGLTVLLGILVAGTVLGTGVMLVRRLTGASRRDRERLEAMMREARHGGLGLDPSMEVLPPRSPERRADALPPNAGRPPDPPPDE
jgi:hypothetical protein